MNKESLESARRDFFIRQSIDYHNKWIVVSTRTHTFLLSMCGRLVNIIETKMMMMMRDMLRASVSGNEKALFYIHCSSTDRHVFHAFTIYPLCPFFRIHVTQQLHCGL